MDWRDDAAWEAGLQRQQERQRPPTLRARALATWASVKALWRDLKRLWWVWLGLLIVVVVVLGWRAVTVQEDRLYALSATDGQVRWSAVLPGGEGEVGHPVASSGGVVVVTEHGYSNPTDADDWQVSAFNPTSGQPLWQQTPLTAGARPSDKLGFRTHVTPAATADHAYLVAVSSHGEQLVTFDMASGRLVQLVPSFRPGDDAFAAPVVASNGRIFLPTYDTSGDRLAALNEADGTERWSVPLDLTAVGDRAGPFFAATSDLVFVVQGQSVVALDAATGAPRFILDDRGDVVTGQLTAVDGTLYRRTGRDTIVAYDAATGQQRWTYTRPLAGDGGELRSFSVADGTLASYCACPNGDHSHYGWLIVLDAIDGHERWQQIVDEEGAAFFQQPLVIGDIVFTPMVDRDAPAEPDHNLLVARSVADGSMRWSLARMRGRTPVGAEGLVFTTNLQARWWHWLQTLGMVRFSIRPA